MTTRLVSDDGSIAKHLLTVRDHTGRPTFMRAFTQRIDPVMEHAAQMKELVNEAPKVGNRSNWHYRGSIPMSMLMSWLQANRYTFDQWARNDDNSKKKFLKWFMQRDFSKLHTSGHLLKVPK